MLLLWNLARLICDWIYLLVLLKGLNICFIVCYNYGGFWRSYEIPNLILINGWVFGFVGTGYLVSVDSYMNLQVSASFQIPSCLAAEIQCDVE